MKKKIMLLIAAFAVTMAANAQFQQGKGYIGASLTGLDMHYNGADKFNIGVEAKGGYLFMDNLMGLAFTSYEHKGHKNTTDRFMIGVGGRYYIIQNGLYLGAGLKYSHREDFNDLVPNLHLGYAFFLSRTVTLEPELYFDFSTKSSDYSNYGLRIGVGVYLFKDQYKIK